jgi:hypothetical protein
VKVTVKRFNVDMEVKNAGIEFEVRSPDGKTHLGDLVLTKSNLIWCPGQTQPKNGYKMPWNDFIKVAEGQDY